LAETLVTPAGLKTAGDGVNGGFHKNFTQQFKFFPDHPGSLEAAEKSNAVSRK